MCASLIKWRIDGESYGTVHTDALLDLCYHQSYPRCSRNINLNKAYSCIARVVFMKEVLNKNNMCV